MSPPICRRCRCLGRLRFPSLRPRCAVCCSTSVPVSPLCALPPPPLSLGLLCLHTPPLALPTSALAADIARKEKDFGDRMGRGEELWSAAGGSLSRGNFPNRPLTIVGYGISRPLFLHRPQQYHPVHFQQMLRHSHALADGHMVGQLDCRVQLQHHSTGL